MRSNRIKMSNRTNGVNAGSNKTRVRDPAYRQAGVSRVRTRDTDTGRVIWDLEGGGYGNKKGDQVF